MAANVHVYTHAPHDRVSMINCDHRRVHAWPCVHYVCICAKTNFKAVVEVTIIIATPIETRKVENLNKNAIAKYRLDDASMHASTMNDRLGARQSRVRSRQTPERLPRVP